MAGLMLFTCALPAMAQDMPLSQVLIDGEGWKVAHKGYSEIYEIVTRGNGSGTPTGAILVLHSNGSDGIAPNGSIIVESKGPEPKPEFTQSVYYLWSQYGTNESKKMIEVTPLIRGAAGYIVVAYERKVAGLACPSGVAVSPDGGTLYVGDGEGKFIWAFVRDGVKTGQPYCPLRMPRGTKASGVTALATDTDGRIYAVTPLGVQIFDPTGRLCGVLTKPRNEPLVGIAFGGPDGHSLYLASKTAIYVRKVKSQGLGFAKAK
jgi:gluconolactonase